MPITWRVNAIGLITGFVMGGIYMLLPFILDNEKKSILDLFYTVIVEIPATIIVYFLIDYPFWGRIRIVNVGAFFCAVSFGVIWWYQERYLVLGLTAFKFFTRISYLAFFPLVIESYSTIYRSMGIGTC